MAEVARRVATGANWIAAGFVHGVLNTDNINITGESFDYGRGEFLHLRSEFHLAYFDETGLYALAASPTRWHQDLTRLAERTCCRSASTPASRPRSTALAGLPTRHLERGSRDSVSLRGEEPDAELALAIFAFLHQSQID